MPPEREPFFAFPALFGAPAYARPPKLVGEADRPFDPDDLPLAAEQNEDESALLRELGLVGRYQGRLVMATADLPGSSVAATSEPPARRLSLRVLGGRIRPRGS